MPGGAGAGGAGGPAAPPARAGARISSYLRAAVTSAGGIARYVLEYPRTTRTAYRDARAAVRVTCDMQCSIASDWDLSVLE
jgi:hypothetical protein